MTRGFSLIEVMVSALILSILFLALLNLLPTSLLSLRRAEKGMAADTIGRSVLEEQHDVPLAQLTTGPLPDRFVDQIPYHISVQTQSVTPHVSTVTVRVGWDDHGGVKNQYYVETLTDVSR